MAIANINIADFLKEGSNITFVVSADGKVITIASAGGAGTWGTITGTLSAQTDLQTALDAKASKTDYTHSFLLGGM